MAKITLDKETEKQNAWTWHYGNVEQNDKEYPFSLLEMYDSTSGTSQFELTWCDETPINADELEDEILSNF